MTSKDMTRYALSLGLTLGLLLVCGTAHAESMAAPDAGPPGCACDDDCVPYGFAICHHGECQPSGFDGAGTPCPPCAAPLQECEGGCVDLETSPLHCGACASPCKVAPGIPFSCVAGSCTCSETVCDGDCVDTDSDFEHCGECGNSCAEFEQCVDGACFCDTSRNHTGLCDGTCVNLFLDDSNCGTCGTVCAADEECIGGCVPRGQQTNPPPDTTPDQAEEGGCAVAPPPASLWVPGLLLVGLLLTPRRPRRRR